MPSSPEALQKALLTGSTRGHARGLIVLIRARRGDDVVKCLNVACSRCNHATWTSPSSYTRSGQRRTSLCIAAVVQRSCPTSEVAADPALPPDCLCFPYRPGAASSCLCIPGPPFTALPPLPSWLEARLLCNPQNLHHAFPTLQYMPSTCSGPSSSTPTSKPVASMLLLPPAF